MSISREHLKERVEQMIDDQNFVAAYMAVKQSGLSDLDRTEMAGQIVARIVDDLGQCTRREERERAIYLRSLLAWIFRDIPGLSSLYREQVRLVHNRGDFATDMYQGIKNINDVASGRKGFSEGLEDTANQVRQNLEDAAENFRSGDASESVRSFLTAAETGLRDGLAQVGRFFEGLNEQSRESERESRESPESDRWKRSETDAEDVEDVPFDESERTQADSSDTKEDKND
ncbi:MAG: hypothetical protein ACLFM0_00785 [Spirochaetales bacterium]